MGPGETRDPSIMTEKEGGRKGRTDGKQHSRMQKERNGQQSREMEKENSGGDLVRELERKIRQWRRLGSRKRKEGRRIRSER